MAKPKQSNKRTPPVTNPFPWAYILVPVLLAAAAYAINWQFSLVPMPYSLASFMFSHFFVLESSGQSFDGREYRLLEYVQKNAEFGDADSVITAFDKFSWEEGEFLMNVGDMKGKILDSAIKLVKPSTVLELGTYLGYSAVRIGRLLPAGSRLYTLEKFAANVDIARKIIEIAGLSGKVKVIHGYIGDGGETISLLRDEGVKSVEVAFLDHFKDAYLPDLKTLEENGFFKRGAVVVADNVLLPGAPDYREYVENSPQWDSVMHHVKVEYQNLLPDIVAVSTYAGTSEQ